VGSPQSAASVRRSGALAGELQRNREAANNGKHRSPIEVALQGLTSRGKD